MKFWKFLQMEDTEDVSPQQQLKKTAFKVHNMRNAFVTMDQAFDYVGDNSSYQKRITTILSFQWLFYSFFVMGMPVILENPFFYCEQSKTQNGDIAEFSSICTEQYACNSNQPFEVSGYQSITKEYELYCKKKFILGWIASLFFIGQSVGGLVFPMLANAFGRKRVILFGMIVGGSSIIVCGICNDVQYIMICFFTAGFGLSGQETVVYVYITEISASRFRSISTNVLVTVWAAAMLVFSSWAHLLRSWRILMIAGIGFPLLIGALATYIFFVESPRWLNSRGKYDECRKVLRFVSTYNHRVPFDFNFVDEMERYNMSAIQLKISDHHKSKLMTSTIQLQNLNKGSSYLDLFRHWKLAKITLILMISWFLRYFAYYGIQFSIETFGGSISYTLIFVSVAEVLAALISAFIKLRMKRISSLQSCLVMITICCLFFFFVRTPRVCPMMDQICQVQQGFTIAMAFILKFAVTFYLTTLNTYTGEVYPTSVRTNGYGVCMTFGSIGSALVPLYVQYMIQNKIAVNPLTNISIISTFVLFLSRFLPETFNQTMCEGIHDEYLNSAFLAQFPEGETEQELQVFPNEQVVSKLWLSEKKI